MASLLNAQIYISDPQEADGISARVELLPRLVSAAFIHATIEQAGWKDNQRSAGKSFAKISSVVDQFSGDERSGLEFILNKTNAISAIDQMTASLQEIRMMISDDDEQRLNKLIKNAHIGHSKWTEQRVSGDWEKYIGEKPPSTKERLGGLIGIRNRKKKNQ